MYGWCAWTLGLSSGSLHTPRLIFQGQEQRDRQEVCDCSNPGCGFVYVHSSSKSKQPPIGQSFRLPISAGKTPKQQRPRPLAPLLHTYKSTTSVCTIEEPTSQCKSPSRMLPQLTLSLFRPRTSLREFRLAISGSDSKHSAACSRTIGQIHVHSVSIPAS